MCVTSTAKRARRHAKNGYKNMSKAKRPAYRKSALADIHQAIAAERQRAARMAAAKSKAKK